MQLDRAVSRLRPASSLRPASARLALLPVPEFYTVEKSNRCVACGEEGHFLRYRVVPSCYRRAMPVRLKSHRSHDVVLLCVACHELAHKVGAAAASMAQNAMHAQPLWHPCRCHAAAHGRACRCSNPVAGRRQGQIPASAGAGRAPAAAPAAQDTPRRGRGQDRLQRSGCHRQRRGCGGAGLRAASYERAALGAGAAEVQPPDAGEEAQASGVGWGRGAGSSEEWAQQCISLWSRKLLNRRHVPPAMAAAGTSKTKCAATSVVSLPPLRQRQRQGSSPTRAARPLVQQHRRRAAS